MLTTCFQSVVAWNSDFSSFAFFFFVRGFPFPHLFSETQPWYLLRLMSHHSGTLLGTNGQDQCSTLFSEDCTTVVEADEGISIMEARGIRTQARKNMNTRFYSPHNVEVGKYVDMYVDIYIVLSLSPHKGPLR